MPSKTQRRIKQNKKIQKKLPQAPSKEEDEFQDVDVDAFLAAAEKEESTKVSEMTIDTQDDNQEEDTQESLAAEDVELNSEDEKELELYMQMMKKATGAGDEESQQKEGKEIGIPTGAVDGEYEERVYPNRVAAIQERLEDLRVPDAFAWIETQCITSDNHTAENISDAHNDLERELAFYKQALDAAVQGKSKILAAGVPFDRPEDYFAEMLKSDEHMERIRQRLLDEAVSLKASEEARKQRELKKFGKKLQQEKLLERQKKKKEELEKIKLARKRGQSRANLEGVAVDDGPSGLGSTNVVADDNDDDVFGVSLDDSESISQKKGSRGNQIETHKKNKKRQHKDEKFGFGGKKRFKKSNTSDSTDDISGFNPKKMKYGNKKGGGRNGPGGAKRGGKVGRR